MNIRIYNYNNYYNRIVKKLTVDSPEYGEFIYEILDANFNPNDGITTEHTFGNSISTYDGSGDYLLCINKNNKIESRWFIVENIRQRGGQWKALLKRDTIAEYYDEIFGDETPAFVEKGYISDVNNPLLLNNEDMSFNQIKTPFDKANNIKEYLLKDETKCPWIVGYMDLENTISGDNITPTSQYQLEADSESAWLNNIYGTGNNSFAVEENNSWIYLYINTDYNGATPTRRTFDLSDPNNILISNEEWRFGTNLDGLYTKDPSIKTVSELKEYLTPTRIAQLYTQLYAKIPVPTISQVASFFELKNKIIKFNDTGKFAKISIVEGENKTTQYNINNTESSGMYTLITNSNPKWFPNTRAIVGNIGYFGVSFKTYKIELTYISINNSISYSIPASRNKLNDAPYSMFCIPYFKNSDDTDIYINPKIGEGDSFIPQQSETFAIINDICKQSGKNTNAEILYDIQLLPYCPLTLENIDNEINIPTRFVENIDYSYIYKKVDDTPVRCGIIFYPQISNFSKDILLENPVTISTNPIERKIENSCNMYRLCSPNYNGIFEFSATKNGGIYKFNIDCTYKPFNPYIHVNPDFGNLYGSDFNDQRGLNCGGDFSLAIITDAWKTYERQNKNYLNTFNRQIENMEINNSVQREQQIWQAVAGSVSGTASGAMTGGMMGGPYGAAVGAIVGGTASIAGGVRDVQLGDILRNEAIDYTKDQFGYQLGNIQALPNSLARTSAFTANNKIFPFLEYYTCTDVEKQALRNKIKYNGMTIMVVDKLKNYINYNTPGESYIKGKIIRLENIADDFHITNDIASEINKGVFV